ncbi:MFS transporter [Natrarchaeobaculum aegyptiacum]|uniref:MFS transporter n=2 Tax=Natrarchaeobaculum aegyptiacum TaxID=745377 RepID=A0A2Z2I1U1_9EURY|nr:MFS transporter [Natrarchaeobaculum aegyptiacum]
MIYPVLLPYFREEFSLSYTAAGFLVTFIWMCYAIGQAPGGLIADRFGERTILTASVVIAVGSLAVVIAAPSALVLFVGTGLVGLGLSQYPIARITVLANLYPDRVGRVIGITMASGDIGQTLLPPIASVLAVGLAWQVGLGWVIPLLCLVAVVLWVSIPSKATTDDADDGETAGFRETFVALRRRSYLSMSVVLFLFIFIWQTFSAFYPTYLTVEKGYSPTVAGVLFGLFFALGVVIKPIAGMAYDSIGAKRSLPVILGSAMIGLLILPFADTTVAILTATLFISTMLGSGAITQSHLAETIPPDMQGTGLGMIRSSATMAGATGPVVFGVIVDRGFFDEGYLVLALLAGVVTLLTLVMPYESRSST